MSDLHGVFIADALRTCEENDTCLRSSDHTLVTKLLLVSETHSPSTTEDDEIESLVKSRKGGREIEICIW